MLRAPRSHGKHGAVRAPPDARAAAIVTALYAAAWIVPWPALLHGAGWLRALLATSLLCLPGYAIAGLRPEDDAAGGDGVATRLLLGFSTSLAVVGIVGLGGSLLRVPTGVATVVIAVALALVLRAAVLRAGAGILVPRLAPGSDPWSAVVVAAALLLGASLAFAPYVGGDDFTHVARVVAFGQNERLGYSALALGGPNVLPPRYWLSFWPLWQALVARLAHVHPLALTANDLGPLLAPLALLAVADLARALGASARLAALAVAAQLALLLCAPARTQPGFLFFDRLGEDKFVAFFVLAPVAFAALARVVAAPRPTAAAYARLACAWVALAFSHPTSLGMTFLVAGAFGTLELVCARAWRATLTALAIVVAVTSGAASVRLVPHPFFDKLERGPEARFASVEQDENPQARINLVAGTPFFGVGRGAAPLGAQAIGGLVLAVALASARRDRLARFVAASLGVVGLAVVPYTGWLIGKVLPPFHLWRILCLVPFGLGAALLARRVATRAPRHVARLAGVALPALLLVAAAGATWGLGVVRTGAAAPPQGWREQLVTVRFDKRKRMRVPYADLLAMQEHIARLVPAGDVVLGDGRTNNLVATLSSRVSVVCFRSVHQTMLHGEMSRADARARCAGQKDLLAGQLPPDAAAEFLSRFGVRWVLAGGGDAWLDAIPATVVSRTPVAAAGSLTLYRLGTGSGARERAS